MISTKKTALVFVGEGARGAFQAGVACRILPQVKPEATYGISSGAVNAVCLAYAPKSMLYELWAKTKNISDIFTFNTWSFFYAKGLYNSKKIGKIAKPFLEARRDESHTIRGATIARCNAITGDLDYLHVRPCVSNGLDVVNYLRDAICISGLVAPREGTDYVDAGSRELNPLTRAVLDGYTDIHLIMGSDFKFPRFTPRRGLFPSVDYAVRSLFVSMHENIINDIADARDLENVSVTAYVPCFELPGQLEFSACKDMVELGFSDFRKIVVV